MKKILIITALVAASVANAQSFVAGWDFDDVGTTASSATANWGDLSGSATLSWSHSPAGGPPFFSAAEFGIGGGFNSAVVGNTFAFVDPTTGYDQFSDGVSAAEAGFNSIASGEAFTLTFDASGYSSLLLSWVADSGSDFISTTVDLSSLAGNAAASYVLNTGANTAYDNFAITGTAVPEPSSFAAIFGVIALAFAANRRRK
jgi:hypothetical protein